MPSKFSVNPGHFRTISSVSCEIEFDNPTYYQYVVKNKLFKIVSCEYNSIFTFLITIIYVSNQRSY